jgi:hypothetical protein
VACMQPDSIRPAAKIPKLALSDDTLSNDIMHFRSKVVRSSAHNAPQTPRFC